MTYKYDKDVDCVYFKFTDAKIVDTIEVSADVFCDCDLEENVVGIEFLNVQTRQEEEVKKLNLPLSPENRQEVNKYFSRRKAIVR